MLTKLHVEILRDLPPTLFVDRVGVPSTCVELGHQTVNSFLVASGLHTYFTVCFSSFMQLNHTNNFIMRGTLKPHTLTVQLPQDATTQYTMGITLGH